MKFKFLFLIIILSAFFEKGHSSENRNEEYFHSVYEKYHSQPTSQEVWENALSKRSNKEYTIIEGDTLWDVSRTLFMDGFFWSKIWA